MDSTLIYQNIILGVLMLVGLLQAFLGQKYKKQTLFSVGAAAAGWGEYEMVKTHVTHLAPGQMTAVLIASSLICGILGGVLLVVIEKFGIFCLGAALGGYGIYALRLVVPAMTDTIIGIPSFPMYVGAVVAGALGGFVAFKLERHIIILSTSIGGAFLFIYGLAYFTKADLSDNSNIRYAFLVGMATLALMGMYVQFRYTGKVVDKKTKEGELSKNLLVYEESAQGSAYGAV